MVGVIWHESDRTALLFITLFPLLRGAKKAGKPSSSSLTLFSIYFLNDPLLHLPSALPFFGFFTFSAMPRHRHKRARCQAGGKKQSPPVVRKKHPFFLPLRFCFQTQNRWACCFMVFVGLGRGRYFLIRKFQKAFCVFGGKI
jgi:hypothetical protein